MILNRKFTEGPFKDLLFRILSHEDSNMVILEFYGGRKFEVPRSDYNGWGEINLATENC